MITQTTPNPTPPDGRTAKPLDGVRETHEAVRDPLDPALLDRLVDDELSEEQRCRLLLALDAAGDGWKRCALAFLEAQSWRRALGAGAAGAGTGTGIASST